MWVVIFIGTASVFSLLHLTHLKTGHATRNRVLNRSQFQSDITEMVNMLEDLQVRDDAIYRTVGTDPLPSYLRIRC